MNVVQKGGKLNVPKVLTDQERVFVDNYAKTNDVHYAVAKAGYSSKSPNQGYDMLKRPKIQNALESKRSAHDILCKAAPAVVDDHVARLLGVKNKNGRQYEKPTHAEFAKLATPFYKALQELGVDLQAIDPEMMSAEQLESYLPILQAEIEQIENRMADRARIIEGEVLETAPENDEDDSGDEDVFS